MTGTFDCEIFFNPQLLEQVPSGCFIIIQDDVRHLSYKQSLVTRDH